MYIYINMFIYYTAMNKTSGSVTSQNLWFHHDARNHKQLKCADTASR